MIFTKTTEGEYFTKPRNVINKNNINKNAHIQNGNIKLTSIKFAYFNNGNSNFEKVKDLEQIVNDTAEVIALVLYK